MWRTRIERPSSVSDMTSAIVPSVSRTRSPSCRSYKSIRHLDLFPELFTGCHAPHIIRPLYGEPPPKSHLPRAMWVLSHPRGCVGLLAKICRQIADKLRGKQCFQGYRLGRRTLISNTKQVIRGQIGTV